MKTAGGENPNHWAKVSSSSAHGADVQNSSCSIMWAGKQENPLVAGVFFLDLPFYRTNQELAVFFNLKFS